MADPFIGEIRMFGGNFAPVGWSFCDGSLLSISENEVLFQLLGTTYGGNGQTTFALPDLRGRVPVHQGQGPGLSTYTLGQPGGVETVTLAVNNLPLHSHALMSADSGQVPSPAGAVLANATSAQNGVRTYNTVAAPVVAMNAKSLQVRGGNQSHENIQPTTAIGFIIALQGVFPTQG